MKSINKGSPGLGNPEIMEFGGFGPSHNKTKNLKQNNPSELSNLLFQHNMFHTNDSTSAKKTIKLRPIIFLWFPMICLFSFSTFLWWVGVEMLHPRLLMCLSAWLMFAIMFLWRLGHVIAMHMFVFILFERRCEHGV